MCASLWSILASATSTLSTDSDFEIVPTFWAKVSVALGPLGSATATATATVGGSGSGSERAGSSGNGGEAPIETQVRAFLPRVAAVLLRSCALPDGLTPSEVRVDLIFIQPLTCCANPAHH